MGFKSTIHAAETQFRPAFRVCDERIQWSRTVFYWKQRPKCLTERPNGLLRRFRLQFGATNGLSGPIIMTSFIVPLNPNMLRTRRKLWARKFRLMSVPTLASLRVRKWV